jgi:beta-glucosidase
MGAAFALVARAQEPVYFDWFEYTGRDAAFEQPLPPGGYRNPILAGFHPDPAITRAADKFYLVNSSFAYFPGIPVYESTDLVHWQQVGNAIDRPRQLDFDGIGISRGVFAPSIAFHDGVFYVLNTAVDAGGNYLVTATNPAGPWSDPVWLKTIDGIDPSLFFDDDGTAYLLNNGPPEGTPRYDGHRAIWMQRFDLAQRQLVGPRKVLLDGGVDPSTKPIWIEGPHIYKRDGWYYLVCAEGGTGSNHSQVVLRSRDVWGPYQPYENNPILTQRDLSADRADPITNAGHAELVEAKDGSWWAVFLASRTYGNTHYNTGRETFLLPVEWRDGWPLILDHARAIPQAAPGPKFIVRDAKQAPLSGNFTWRDDFDKATLDPAWMFVRVPKQPWADLRSRRGRLAIHPLAEGLDTLCNPSFLARRQQHIAFEASTALALPAQAGVSAGLAVFQNEKHWYFVGVRRRGEGAELFLEKDSGQQPSIVATTKVAPVANLKLRVSANGASYSFAFDAGSGWQWISRDDDGSILSTDVAGGFVGATLGPYARIENAAAIGEETNTTKPTQVPAGSAAATLPYLDPDRSFAERAADLVSRMTLEEKVSQMQNVAAAIPRLGVPAYDWWNEALHGVARAGEATVFPQAIALAATFDTALMGEVATAISDEARAKHNRFMQLGWHRRYGGLTFWSPNINIFRDPRWGRGQETYGEDPYLTARMGVAFVRGLQDDDPASAQEASALGRAPYRKVDATAKHFAVHSGPEALRHQFDVHPNERDLHETYLPAFQALVQEAHVDAVMGAYNRVDGESASASQRLLQDFLRRDWGFAGYVVSDCDAVEDIWKHHGIVATAAQAAALAVKHGDDLNCGKTYAALTDAVREGLVSEAEIDTALQRLMLARMRLGMFDPPERVPWSKIPYSVNQSPEHDALARRAARESIVLLKNDGTLPLSKSLRRVAVIGPTADDTMALLGNYYGTPTGPTTILQGIRAALPQADVRYARGADLVEQRNDPAAAPLIESRYLRPRAELPGHGLKGEYFRGNDCSGTPVLTRVDAQVGFRWDRGAPTDDLVARGELPLDRALDVDHFCIRWTGQLLAPVSGRYELSVAANDGARLWLDGKLVIDEWTTTPRLRARSAFVELAANQPHDLRLEYFEDERDAEVRLAWRLPGTKPLREEALDAARDADVVIFVGGLTGDVEGEEMEVSYPGFAGGDRTDLRLPKTQQQLLEALRATGKPVVLVLTTGSALAVDWAQQHLPAVLLAWYPGQRGGEAVADVLFGDANPGGRLPVTFYRAEEKLPPFDDYAMRGRTYRYFAGKPLYPFGYGLSYTRFAWSDLRLDHDRVGANDALHVSLRVKNSGQRAGDEVVQLYLRPLAPRRERANRELRGFRRVTLQPGEERELSFAITPASDLRIYDDARNSYAVDPGAYEVEVAASSADVRLRQQFTVEP